MWKIDWVSKSNQLQINYFLNSGWEPFAVSQQIDTTDDVIYFKKLDEGITEEFKWPTPQD